MIEIAPALPAGLVLVPLSRRPLLLPPETAAAALALKLPGPCGPARSPAVSIVVVTHGNLAVTRLCLASLLGDQAAPGLEVIVVDNASTDATPWFLADLARSHAAVRAICNSENVGFAAAVNQGLAAARAETLVILNNDVVVPPGWLQRLLPVLADRDVGMVGPVTNAAPNEARVPTSYTTYGDLLEHAEARWAAHGTTTFDIPVLTMFCVAMRRDVLRSVGPLDEQFGLGLFEDDDYARRVGAAGLRLVCAEGAFVHHFGEATFGALVPTGEHGALFRRNQARFEQKWGEAWVPHRSRQHDSYEQVVERIREIVAATVPAGASLAVVSKGDERLVDHPGLMAWHLPRGADGRYAGHHPADSEAAVEQLRALRGDGVTHLVLPQTARWWLDHYDGLAGHLQRHWILEVDDEACTIFRRRGG